MKSRTTASPTSVTVTLRHNGSSRNSDSTRRFKSSNVLDEADDERTQPRSKSSSEKRYPVIIDLSACRYQVVRDCAEEMGWVESSRPGQSDDFTIYWTDLSVSSDRVMKLKNFQFINHFPGMNGICRKIPLARNLNRLKKVFPAQYSFFPHSWVLPSDYSAFQRFKFQEGRTFIIKPNSGSQGRGIILTRDKKEVEKHGDCVVQIYVDRPFLIEDRKFDLRVYCLVLSVDPELRAFMYRDGLVRLCTENYKRPTNRNIQQACMHLTNYSLNRRNDQFQSNKDDDFGSGSKRNFQFLNNYLARLGQDPTKIWADIADVLLKTIISIAPQLKKQYRLCLNQEKFNPFTCFEILGFDILLDYRLKPWLIEVNHSPSFNTDTPLDKHVKYGLVSETMRLLCVDPRERAKYLRMEKILARERIHGEASGTRINGGGGESTSMDSRFQPLSRQELINRQEANEAQNLELFDMIYPKQSFDLATSLEEQLAGLSDDTDVPVRRTTPYSIVEKYASIMEQSERISSFGTDNHIQRLYPEPSTKKKAIPLGDRDCVVVDTRVRNANNLINTSSLEDRIQRSREMRRTRTSKYNDVQSKFMDVHKRSRCELEDGEDSGELNRKPTSSGEASRNVHSFGFRRERQSPTSSPNHPRRPRNAARDRHPNSKIPVPVQRVTLTLDSISNPAFQKSDSDGQYNVEDDINSANTAVMQQLSKTMSRTTF